MASQNEFVLLFDADNTLMKHRPLYRKAGGTVNSYGSGRTIASLRGVNR